MMLSLAMAMIVMTYKPLITYAVASQPKIPLANAAKYAVLAYAGVTNTGTTKIVGDVGVSPLTSITGKETITITGAYHEADASVALAQISLTEAITNAAGRSATTILTELGNQTLIGGVYTSASGTFGITGELILDGQNNKETVFIFKIASTLITAENSKVTLINGAQACNVFWQVGSSATLGTGSMLAGHVLATESITANTGVIVNGSLLANTGAVTLSGNTITNSVFSASTTAG